MHEIASVGIPNIGARQSGKEGARAFSDGWKIEGSGNNVDRGWSGLRNYGRAATGTAEDGHSRCPFGEPAVSGHATGVEPDAPAVPAPKSGPAQRGWSRIATAPPVGVESRASSIQGHDRAGGWCDGPAWRNQ